MWNTDTGQGKRLGSGTRPVRSVSFGGDDDLLLVDGEAVASLWSLKEGRIRHQARHSVGDAPAVFTGDALVLHT